MKNVNLILFLIFIISCGRREANNQTEAIITTNQAATIALINNIDLFTEPESSLTYLSDIATEIGYIPLQTSNNSIVEGIFRIEACGWKTYVSKIDEIMCFDSTGHFLYKLSGYDKAGKRIYEVIDDFDVSSDDSVLVILTGGKVMLFNNTISGFSFIRSISLKQPFPSRISIVPGTHNIMLSIIPSRGNEPSLNVLINLDGDTLTFKPNLYTYERANKYHGGLYDEIILYKFMDMLCFKEAFSDTIFYINNETNDFKPWLILDSHGTLIKPWLRGNSEAYSDKYLFENDSLTIISNIIETKRFLMFSQTIINRFRMKVCYDKFLDEKFQIVLEGELKDNIIGGPKFHPKSCNEGKLYSWISAKALKKHVSSEEFKNLVVNNPEKKEALRKLADSLSETDNPVLIIVTPKE